MIDFGNEWSGQFSVIQFFPDDSYEKVLNHVGAEQAMKTFVILIRSTGARIGTTKRVIVTDGGDFTNVEWVHGKGIVFPPELADCDPKDRIKVSGDKP